MTMTITKITSESILKYFKSIAATKEFERIYSSYLGDGYWLDLGFDIQQGAGHALEFAESYMTSYLNELPELILYSIWWDSAAGQVARRKLDGSESFNADYFAELRGVPKSEIVEDVAEFLLDKVRRLAERAYIKYSSNK
ncbi:MAG: hypothetical protein PsegKO_13670 [Pseudohongiellaceae bacterium]